MNNDKPRNTLLAIAGGYLAYLGVSLVTGYVNGEYDNGIFPMVFGVLFIIAGGIILYTKGKVLMQKGDTDTIQEEMEMTEAEIEMTEAEIEQNDVKEVVMEDVIENTDTDN